MVVGLVLAGKVVIDWGPAMLHAREGSFDSRLMDQFQLNAPASRYPEPLRNQHVRVEHEPKCDGKNTRGRVILQQPMNYPSMSPYGTPMPAGMPHMMQRSSIGSPSVSQLRGSVPYVPEHCLIYSQYNSSLNSIPSNHGHDRRSSSMPRHLNQSKQHSPRNSLYTTHSNHSNHSGEQSLALSDVCECSQYGTMRRNDPPFQGESFILNERSYLI
ncbi:unnamed protein product [Caenorhabditis auriculariae]|uniref:Uncharacterized protein n=1 Tax=Caenorhabditis auriculariae TaxID=2777116 RepID=A0A8S1H5A6_9PELO|nr:unnamed protein product [Caenorhabditis auriculariae]